MRRSLIPILLVAGFLGLPLPAMAARSHDLGVQGGWFNLEAEYRHPSGLFFDLGFPWVGWVMETQLTSGTDWAVAGEAKLGIDFPLTPIWSLRGGVRTALVVSEGCPCADGETERTTKDFTFLELGLRGRWPSGFVAGLELPLYVFGNNNPASWGLPPVAFAFSQAYLGWAWAL